MSLTITRPATRRCCKQQTDLRSTSALNRIKETGTKQKIQKEQKEADTDETIIHPLGKGTRL